MDDLPRFDALSYAWGDQRIPSETIRVNSRRFGIRIILGDALWFLLKTEAITTYLWIDAICINQADLDERASQVQLMKQIYSKAQTVRIWLDHDIPEVEVFFQKLAAGEEPYALLDINDGSLEGFRYVISQSWWLRLWVFQEVLLAKLAIMHCGPLMIPWDTMYRGIGSSANALLERPPS